MSEKSVDSRLLDLIPEVLHEDLFKQIKTILFEKGRVKEIEKPEVLTTEELEKMDDKNCK